MSRRNIRLGSLAFPRLTYLDASLKASLAHAAAMTALVDATLGMILLTTPCVSRYVTPLMPYSVARADACEKKKVGVRIERRAE